MTIEVPAQKVDVPSAIDVVNTNKTFLNRGLEKFRALRRVYDVEVPLDRDT
jgi:hypothetical protein